MNDTVALPDPHRIARAFLALSDDDALAPLPHSTSRWIVALAAAVVLALSVPVSWFAPPAHTLGKLRAPPAAPPRKARRSARGHARLLQGRPAACRRRRGRPPLMAPGADDLSARPG